VNFANVPWMTLENTGLITNFDYEVGHGRITRGYHCHTPLQSNFPKPAIIHSTLSRSEPSLQAGTAMIGGDTAVTYNSVIPWSRSVSRGDAKHARFDSLC
jgi:hypothetical protein